MTPIPPNPPADVAAETLVELRRINGWFEQQRKLTRRVFMVGGVFVLLFVPGLIVLENTLKKRLSPNQAAQTEPTDWADVRRFMWEGKYDCAVKESRALLEKQPANPSGHHQLGLALLHRGDVAEARVAFARAVELYPVAEYRDALAAVEKRLAAPASSADGS